MSQTASLAARETAVSYEYQFCVRHLRKRPDCEVLPLDLIHPCHHQEHDVIVGYAGYAAELTRLRLGRLGPSVLIDVGVCLVCPALIARTYQPLKVALATDNDPVKGLDAPHNEPPDMTRCLLQIERDVPSEDRWRCETDHVSDEKLLEVVDVEYINREQFKHLVSAEPVVSCISRELVCADRFTVDVVNLRPYPLLESGIRRDILVLEHDVVNKDVVDEHALGSHHVQRHPVSSIHMTPLD